MGGRRDTGREQDVRLDTGREEDLRLDTGREEPKLAEVGLQGRTIEEDMKVLANVRVCQKRP